MSFLAIKSYYSRLDLKLLKFISIITIAHNKREARDANVFIKKLKALRKFLRT